MLNDNSMYVVMLSFVQLASAYGVHLQVLIGYIYNALGKSSD